jgi:hypothetical protein
MLLPLARPRKPLLLLRRKEHHLPTSVDAEVVVPVGHRLNEESAKTSPNGAILKGQNKTVDALTPTEANRTQTASAVRQRGQKRRLSQVDEALMYDCPIDIVVKQDLVKSERAKKSKDDKRRNEEIRAAGGQCLRCKHLKLAVSSFQRHAVGQPGLTKDVVLWRQSMCNMPGILQSANTTAAAKTAASRSSVRCVRSH